jgi:hypothetical protein
MGAHFRQAAIGIDRILPVPKRNSFGRILFGHLAGQNPDHKNPKNVLTSLRFCGLIVVSKIKPI